MKKLLSIVALLTVVSLSVNAQDLKSKKGENYLPEKGDWSIGFNADGMLGYFGNIFNGSTENDASVDFPGSDVSFLNDATFVGKRFTSNNTATRYTANLVFTSVKEGDADPTTNMNITAGYGKEWRKGKTRLQGFYGADALLGFGSSKTSSGDKTSSFGIGVNGFIGAEYFVLPKMAIGAQYNYGIGFSQDTDADDVKTSSFGLNEIGLNGGSLSLNLYF
jgi:hypothetical protein